MEAHSSTSACNLLCVCLAGTLLPTLAKGADDIFWVHQLHEALVASGYFPDDDEVADWLFGDHTAHALSMFQVRTLNCGK